ncbi:hypothetical protein BKA69DRAFT_1061241 [Paraphysoderma sedebokerense]|nr:hypothetical protein BKA69DRAFT_1061241 [Paraphysoderma sedebokerense]
MEVRKHRGVEDLVIDQVVDGVHSMKSTKLNLSNREEYLLSCDELLPRLSLSHKSENSSPCCHFSCLQRCNLRVSFDNF